MEYNVTEESPVRKKINITVTPEEVGAAIDKAADRCRREVTLRGYRKGKAPRAMVEQYFRDKVYNEAAQALYEAQTPGILDETKLRPVSRARFEGGELKRGAPFEYHVSFDVMPDFELPEYVGIQLEQDLAYVNPKEIDAVFERIQNNLATQILIEEDRPAREGEAALIDFETFDEKGEPIESMKAQNFLILLGRSDALKDLDALVRTLAPGQEKTQAIEFPKNFSDPAIAGRTLTMHVKVLSIHQHIKPELDDDLARRAGGMESLERMRESIEKSFLQRRTEAAKQKAMLELVEMLMAKVEFPLPEALVEEQTFAFLNEFGERMIKEGKEPTDIGKTFEELRKEAKAEAEKAVKAQILLMKIAEKEGIEVTDEEVERQMRSFAVRSGQEAAALREEYERNGMLGGLRQRILSDKTLKAIYEKAKVVMIPPLNPDEKEEEEEGEAASEAAAPDAAPEPAKEASADAPAPEAGPEGEAGPAEEAASSEEKPKRGRSKAPRE